MIEDKCPTCPRLDTGQYCSCSNSLQTDGNPLGVSCLFIAAVATIIFFLILVFA